MKRAKSGTNLAKSSFGQRARNSQKKINNHKDRVDAKIKIRQQILTDIGPENAHVFDAFCGEGVQFRAVWHEAKSYLGCDLVWYQDNRTQFMADNRRVMRCIDLRRFNVFDLDAHGSPWEQVLILTARRSILEPGERLGLVLTEGSGMKVKMGGYPTAMRLLAGIMPGAVGGSSSTDELLNRCIAGLCRRMNAKVLRRWQAGKTGGQTAMRYVGLVLEGKEARPKPG